MHRNLEEKEVSILEILVKTSYQTQVTHPDDNTLSNPVAFGSGFLVNYNDRLFFVTADHVLHLDDYKPGENKRTWTDYVISIFNNIQSPDNFLTTLVTPLGGFFYMEQLDLDKPNEIGEPVDITLCEMNPINIPQPFLTDEVQFIGETINSDQQKWKIQMDGITKPKTNTNYLIYGKIRTKLDGIQLKSEPTLKENLRFVEQMGDYYLFNSEVIINDKYDWKGLSGSPIISEEGDCVGVLCSINEKSKSVWVMPFDKVKMLMEVAIHQNSQENKT